MADEEKNTGSDNSESQNTNEQPKLPDGFDIMQTKEAKGLVKDVQAERQRRQQLEEQIGSLQQQLTDLNLQLADRAKSKEDTDDELDDDDVLTVAEARKLFAKVREQDKAQVQKNEQEALSRRYMESEETARAELTAEKMGEGLDYDTVLREGGSHLTKGDKININNSPDPAREAYECCLRRSPMLRKRSEAVRNARLVDKLKEGSTPKGSGGGDVSELGAEYDRFMSMPEAELEKQLRANSKLEDMLTVKK